MKLIQPAKTCSLISLREWVVNLENTKINVTDVYELHNIEKLSNTKKKLPVIQQKLNE